MNINDLPQELKKFFSEKKLKKLAKKSNFIIRERKITALTFVKNMMFAGVRDDNTSLEYMVTLFDDDGVSLAKQSLNEKMNEKGVAFLKTIFERLCQQFMGKKFLLK
jgi:hypothetical protein